MVVATWSEPLAPCRAPAAFTHLVPLDNGNTEPLRLLDDDGRVEPTLRDTPHGVLAALAEAVHAAGCHLTETQLRHLELFVALQRWHR